MKKPVKYLTIGLLAAVPLIIWAADHAEAPIVASDQGADIADVYAFLDPNDNTKAVLAFDVHGFIVPGENGNFGGFDADVTFRLNIENTGDAKPDKYIDVTFEEQTSRSQPQTAHIRLASGKDLDNKKRSKKKNDRNDGISFTAPTTVSSATSTTAPTPVVTTDPSGISFFAGVTDDPFFFDIPAFNRFLGSVLSGTPQLNFLTRGRDTFAGYNIQMIAVKVPVNLLKGSAGNVIGVSATTLRHRISDRSVRSPKEEGALVAVDRMGVPAINTVLIPFLRKNEYNRASTVDDSAGQFAGDIVATLQAVGTDAAHIGILAGVAVTKGDMLRLDTSVGNSGPQGGTTANAGFPNGRRPSDDVIDTVLFLVTNEALTTGDNVNANDASFRDSFPFFAPSHQPLNTGAVDDHTRN